MKYIFNILAVMLVALGAVSCSKEEPGNTSTVNVAGEWYCTVDVVDQAGEVVMEDPYGLGPVLFMTYNTATDNGTEMWVDDMEGFWDFKVKVPAAPASYTFGGQDMLDNVKYESQVKVFDGKVTPGGAVSPAGYTADAIEFKVTFDDDPYEFTYLVHGYRRTGLDGGND